MAKLTDKQYESIGKEIASILFLREMSRTEKIGGINTPVFDTLWGTKTHIGIAKVMQRLLEAGALNAE